MSNLNIEFLETYKLIDNFCSDIFRNFNFYDNKKSGVTLYLEKMKAIEAEEFFLSSKWHDTYRKLRHFRHIRNHLTHDRGAFSEPVCGSSDILWLNDFHRQLISFSDPISLHINPGYDDSFNVIEKNPDKKSSSKVISKNQENHPDNSDYNKTSVIKTLILAILITLLFTFLVYVLV